MSVSFGTIPDRGKTATAEPGNLLHPIFQDADEARKYLEARIWKDGRICPHCGSVGESTLMQGKTTRPGLYQCNDCRKPFTVTVGTLYERSHVPLHKWLAATFLLMSSKKGISALQVGRMLGLSKKTAWFLCHRIRESLRPTNPTQLGGANQVVEVDETYVGGKAKNKAFGPPPKKEAVVALVEREGRVRSMHVPNVKASTLKAAIHSQVDRKSYLMTDEAPAYVKIGAGFRGHGTVNHSIEEYVRGYFWHTNTIESYFSIMKRGIVGVYHHVSQQHLKRYLAEFDFRYNERAALGTNDFGRFQKSIPGIVGKRLMYRRAGQDA